MSTTTEEDLSAAQAAISQFTRAPVASASAPPSSPPASGSSGSSGTGSGSSGADGSGGSPPGDSTGISDNNHEGGGNMGDSNSSNIEKRKNIRFYFLLVFGIVSLIATVSTIISMNRYSSYSMTPEGAKVRKEIRDTEDRRHARDKEVELAEIHSRDNRTNERREMRAYVAGVVPPTTSMRPSPSSAPSVCIDARGKGGKRAEAIELSYGSCVSFSTTSNQSSFWVSFKGYPRGVIGDAVFGSFHDATDGDREERHARCMQKTNDREYCDGEKRKPLVIRDDRGCGSAQASDHCLAYLKSKAEQGTIPVWVQTYTSVQINM